MTNVSIRAEHGVRRVVPDYVLRRAVRVALSAERVRLSEVNILLCSRRSIRALNRRFRGTDRVTDVLSFPPNDIALCTNKVRQQARQYRHSRRREAVYLTVHALLHLLGYDHETCAADEAEMTAHAERIMRQLRIDRFCGTMCFGRVAE